MVLTHSLYAGLLTWGFTALGAACVFFFKKINDTFLSLVLGFASGVMIAASFWSLLAPSIAMSKEMSMFGFLIPAIGFLLGGLFLFILDKILSDITKEHKNNALHRKFLLLASITIHNIPEGLAVGVAYGFAYTQNDSILKALAFSLALGIAIQNFPEGIASSVPLLIEGFSRKKSFFYGQLTGIVEPISCVIGALLVTYVSKILPYALSFAAGCMIFVVVQELIPKAQETRHNRFSFATFGVMIGFVCMMILDVALS